jgi:hypothetical protein
MYIMPTDRKLYNQAQESMMRLLLLASLFLASLALSGCWSMRTDANTKATPKKKMSFFSCPADGGPCVAEATRAE